MYLWLFCVFLALPVTVLSEPTKLKILSEARAEKFGAYCLDGSRPAYFHQEAKKARRGRHEDWVVYLQGGGWCSSEEECLARSKTALGSSKHMPESFDFAESHISLLSTNPDVNNFHNFHMVYIQYCDGSSYSGNKTIEKEKSGKDAEKQQQLFYRGHAVLEAILDELANEYGLKRALRVLLSGCSAGALGVYLHADRIRDEYLLDVLEFQALPSAGMFLWERSAAGTNVYENKMRSVHKLHEAVVHCECAQKHRDDEALCMSPSVIIPHMRTPTFIIDSLYDQWQLQNIIGYVDCANGPDSCNEQEIDYLSKKWAPKMIIAASQMADRSTGGMWLSSCWSHCGMTQSGEEWTDFTVVGGDPHMSVMQAVSDFFHDQAGMFNHTYVDCLVSKAGPCNEKCPKGWGGKNPGGK